MVRNSNTQDKDNQEQYNQLSFVTNNRFYVEVDKTIAASFTECSGIGIQIKKNVFREGGVNNQQRIYLGQTDFTDVTLKRGITDHAGFWDWLNQLFDETKATQRINVNILVFDRSGETMMSWTLIGAIPIAWKTPALQADGNAVAIEELTIAYEGITVGKKAGGGNKTGLRRQDGSFASE